MHHHHHGHGATTSKILWLAIYINIAITLALTIGGFLADSLAILSDALHNFSDIIALIISLLAARLAQKETTHGSTFGFKRAEIVAALVNSVTLVIIAVFLCYEAIERLFWEPAQVDPQMMMILAVVSIVGNGFCAYLLHQGAQHSLNLRSAYLHLFSDMLSSIAVLFGGMAIYFFGWNQIDNLLAIGIALYLVISAGSMLWTSLKILMQFTPAELNLKAVEQLFLSHEQVKNVHHIHAWQLDDNQTHFEAHVDFNNDLALSEAGRVIASIKQDLAEKFAINHVVLEPEFGVKDAKDLVQHDCAQPHT